MGFNPRQPTGLFLPPQIFLVLIITEKKPILGARLSLAPLFYLLISPLTKSLCSKPRAIYIKIAAQRIELVGLKEPKGTSIN